MDDARETYWRIGATLIEGCLAKAVRAEHADAPFPLDETQAKLWHRAQAEAYRHALEMMAPPEAGTSDELLARTNASTQALIDAGRHPGGAADGGDLVHGSPGIGKSTIMRDVAATIPHGLVPGVRGSWSGTAASDRASSGTVAADLCALLGTLGRNQIQRHTSADVDARVGIWAETDSARIEADPATYRETGSAITVEATLHWDGDIHGASSVRVLVTMADGADPFDAPAIDLLDDADRPADREGMRPVL